MDQEDDTCPICMDQPISAELECKHLFCLECIEQWQKRPSEISCPLCRTPITKVSRINVPSSSLSSPSLSKEAVQVVESQLSCAKRAQCQGIKRDGKQCRYKAWTADRDFCKLHDPELIEARREMKHRRRPQSDKVEHKTVMTVMEEKGRRYEEEQEEEGEGEGKGRENWGQILDLEQKEEKDRPTASVGFQSFAHFPGNSPSIASAPFVAPAPVASSPSAPSVASVASARFVAPAASKVKNRPTLNCPIL